MEFRLLREEAWWANTRLPRAGLLTMHSGNASGIHSEVGIIIKPSGVDYDRLRPEDLVPVDLSGAVGPAAGYTTGSRRCSARASTRPITGSSTPGIPGSGA